MPVLQSLSNTVKDFQLVKLGILFKRDPRSGISRSRNVRGRINKNL